MISVNWLALYAHWRRWCCCGCFCCCFIKILGTSVGYTPNLCKIIGLYTNYEYTTTNHEQTVNNYLHTMKQYKSLKHSISWNHYKLLTITNDFSHLKDVADRRWNSEVPSPCSRSWRWKVGPRWLAKPCRWNPGPGALALPFCAGIGGWTGWLPLLIGGESMWFSKKIMVNSWRIPRWIGNIWVNYEGWYDGSWCGQRWWVVKMVDGRWFSS